jgi:hypothetical protein
MQHIIEEPLIQDMQRAEDSKGVVVPLDLPGLRILSQQLQPNGSIEVEVIGTNERAECLHCQQLCVKVHDTRLRRKRDVSLRGHRMVLLLHKRRALRAFVVVILSPRPIVLVEAHDTPRCACVNRSASRRLVSRWRKIACAFEVGRRFVQQCLETVAAQELAQRGLRVDETAPLPTPRYLGIKELALFYCLVMRTFLGKNGPGDKAHFFVKVRN